MNLALCGNSSCPIGECAKCKFPHHGNDIDYPTDDEVTSPNGGCCVYNSSQTNIKEIVANKGNGLYRYYILRKAFR